jgi:hypothetical protein
MRISASVANLKPIRYPIRAYIHIMCILQHFYLIHYMLVALEIMRTHIRNVKLYIQVFENLIEI